MRLLMLLVQSQLLGKFVAQSEFVIYLQLSQKTLHQNSNLRPVATGSWGCGSQQAGDAQFKVIIQWLAASVANVPTLTYYTCANESLSKLDTVVRVLHGEFHWPFLSFTIELRELFIHSDRRWTVGELLRHAVFYAKDILNNPKQDKSLSFFDKLIGLERSN